MRVTLNGKRWLLFYAPLDGDDGQCDAPNKRNKRITVDPRVKFNDRQHMEIVLHEMLHAADWAMDEEYVDAYATEAARVLYKLGFRRVVTEGVPL